AGVLPAMPPAVRRRRRHAEGGRGRPQRHPARDRRDERIAASQSELRVTVQRHPSPPLGVSPGRPTASKEGRISPQPFTTCVGGTPSQIPRATVQELMLELERRKANPRDPELTQLRIAERVGLNPARVQEAEALRGIGWDLLRTHPDFSIEDGFVRWPTPTRAA